MKWAGLRTLVASLVLAVLAPSASHANAPGAVQPDSPVLRQVLRVATDVGNAFARRSAVFQDDRLDQLDVPTTAADLFPQYGFAPGAPLVSWQLQPLNEDQVRLCLAVTLSSLRDWQAYLRALEHSQLQAATAGCTERLPVQGLPAAFPVQRYAQLMLDRRRVPTPTEIDEGLQLAVVDAEGEELVEPGPVRVVQVLKAYQLTPSPRMRLKLTNATGRGVALQLTGVYAPEWIGFENNTCEVLPQGESCSVDLRYLPQDGVASTAARTWFEFHVLTLEEEGLVLTDERVEASVTLIGQASSEPMSEPELPDPIEPDLGGLLAASENKEEPGPTSTLAE